jgi:NTE family protein
MDDDVAVAGGDEFDPRDARPVAGVGLCLSGGGYRAMLFHLGSLRRLNEAGRLATVTRVASVSGGSIIAALLGLRWTSLDFRPTGAALTARQTSDQTDRTGKPLARGPTVAQRFDELVEEPILDLAGRGIDVRAVLTGLRPGRISRKVQRFYDRHLYKGATLQDLPADVDGPRFVILATNLTNGTLWRFSRPYMRDWRTESIPDPTVPLAHAVAASSAFPPVLSPSLLDIPGREELVLTDGGVYDNLGLEPVVKRCRTIYVSDGGSTYKESSRPRTDWLLGTVRVLNTIDVEVRRLRRRQVVGALRAGERDGAFWAINSDPADFAAAATTLHVESDRARELSLSATRLAKLNRDMRHHLANWGYAVTDAALRTYLDADLPEPDGFPYSGGVG